MTQDSKKSSARTSCVMDIEQIKKLLPHRYPFLFVDRVIEMTENTLVAIKNVTGNESFFQGHFPQKPVMPGVLMLEALAQAGGLLALSKPHNRGKLAFLASMKDVKFRKIVVPGDQLRLETTILKEKSRVGVMTGVAKVDGEEVCSAEIMFTLAAVPKEE